MMQEAPAPKVSVCVITYNQRKYIRQCLQSLVDQVVQFDFEIIVGDDCSTDGTSDIVYEFEQRYPNLLKSIRQPRNTGGSKNNLDVHAAARGLFVAHLDGDDYALPGKLQKQVDVLDADHTCNAVWHRVDYFDDLGGFCSGETADLSSFKDGLVTFSDAIRLGFVGVYSSLMYRRSARTQLASDRRILDLYFTWDLLSTGGGRIVDTVLGRYRVAATGSLTVVSQRRMKLLSIEHASEFLARCPERRQDFLVWALCRAMIEAKNLHLRTVLDFVKLARCVVSPVGWVELRSNMERMRRTQVRWRHREQQPMQGR